jgi:hypothetical protein
MSFSLQDLKISLEPFFQIEALNKLKTITSLLYNVDRDKKEKGLQTMKQCLQQKTYQDALSKLTSPLDPTYKLRRLR